MLLLSGSNRDLASKKITRILARFTPLIANGCLPWTGLGPQNHGPVGMSHTLVTLLRTTFLNLHLQIYPPVTLSQPCYTLHKKNDLNIRPIGRE